MKPKERYSIEVVDKDTIIFNKIHVLKRTYTCSTRHIFMNEKYVLKYDYNDMSISWTNRQCLNEAKFYEEIMHKKDRRYFAIIVQHGVINNRIISNSEMYYVIQTRSYPKKRAIKEETVTKLNKILREIRLKYDLHDLSGLYDDNSSFNVHINTRDNIKIYDYASIPALNYPLEDNN